MQKKVIALAVAGLVSGAAFAQTNVTIYGAADATFEMVQAKGASEDIGVRTVNAAGTPVATQIALDGNKDILRHTRVQSNSSILGFRGSEDLGGGLKAIFQFETGITQDVASAATFNRDTFVGLQGGFGQIKGGLITGPARSLGAAVDLTVGATGIGANTAMLGKLGGNPTFTRTTTFNPVTGVPVTTTAASGAAFSYWDTRRSNSIQYTTPKFGGFEIRAMYGAGELRPEGTKAAVTYEVGAFYNNGPWYAGLTYGQAKANDAGYAAGAPLGVVPDKAKLTNVRLAGKYTFQGGHQISALFEQNKGTDLAVTVVPQTATASARVMEIESAKSYTYGIGGKFKVSQPGAIIVQLYQVGKMKNVDEANKFKANFVALGYEHSLSKRTTLKAYYSRIANKDYAAYNYGIGNINGAGMGSNPNGFALGVRHTF
jgi:predicted porin